MVSMSARDCFKSGLRDRLKILEGYTKNLYRPEASIVERDAEVVQV